MQISSYQTQQPNTIFQIKKVQRILDQTQQKFKQFKKYQSSYQQSTPYYRSTPLPDLSQYLSYLLSNHAQSQEQTPEQPQQYSLPKNPSNIDNIQTIDKNLNYPYNHNQLNFKTHQYILKNKQNLHLNKHTQLLLSQCQQISLWQIQVFYKENCLMLDQKIRDIQGNLQKVKQDKVLLMRDNQQLQAKINKFRQKKQQKLSTTSPQLTTINKLNIEINKLQKKLQKIELQKIKIIKKKQNLQTNMKICIKNHQQLNNQICKINKSKFVSKQKCPYH